MKRYRSHELFEKLNNAYKGSSKKFNVLLDTINEIEFDEKFETMYNSLQLEYECVDDVKLSIEIFNINDFATVWGECLFYKENILPGEKKLELLALGN